MSKTPPTFGTNPNLHSGIDWDDPCALSRRGDGEGLLFELKVIRRGPLCELVRDVMRLPPEMRRHYVVEIPGNRRLDFIEIEGLAGRADFPSDRTTRDKDEGT